MRNKNKLKVVVKSNSNISNLRGDKGEEIVFLSFPTYTSWRTISIFNQLIESINDSISDLSKDSIGYEVALENSLLLQKVVRKLKLRPFIRLSRKELNCLIELLQEYRQHNKDVILSLRRRKRRVIYRYFRCTKGYLILYLSDIFFMMIKDLLLMRIYRKINKSVEFLKNFS